MTNPQALKDLLAKVKAGEARPWGIRDAAIRVWPADADSERWWLITDSTWQAYEGSLDAALSLMQAVLPGAQASMAFDGSAVVVTQSNRAGCASGKGRKPARALLIAILKALIAEQEDGE